MTREEAIEELSILLNKYQDGHFGDAIDMAMTALEQEPKAGHWIEERTYMECPNCHDIWHYEENQTERFKCCPTCGERIK